MNTQTRREPIDELREYIGSAYHAIASMEKRITALEAEIIQHGQTLTNIPYLAKPAEPVRTGMPPGYEIFEGKADDLFYWRKATEPPARANFGEPTYDLARVAATYHYLRKKHDGGSAENGAIRPGGG